MGTNSDRSSSILDSLSVSSKKLKSITITVKKGTKMIVWPFKRAKQALSTHSSCLSIASSLPASDDGDDNKVQKSVQGSASGTEDEIDPGKQLGVSFSLNIATLILNSFISRGSQKYLALSNIYIL
jgi:hypothetical protein